MEQTGTLSRTETAMVDDLDHGAVGLPWVAADGTLLWAHRADYAPRGSTREEDIGHAIAEFHADPDVIEDMFNRLSKGETRSKHQARLRRKHGSLQHVLIASSVRFDDHGHVVHTRGFTVFAPATVGTDVCGGLSPAPHGGSESAAPTGAEDAGSP